MKSTGKFTRRKFISQSAAVAAGTVVAAKVLPRIASAAEAPKGFNSQWEQSLDRVWLGPEYWANPMQDWDVKNGRVQCVNAALDRQVHLLTHQVGPQRGTITMSVKIGRVGGGKLSASQGSFGMRLGILGTLKDYPERHDYRNNLWPAPGSGFHIGLTSKGALFIGGLGSAANSKVLVDLDREAVELSVQVEPKADDFEVTLTVFDAATHKQLGQSTVEKVNGAQLIGNIALINNFGTTGPRGAKAKGKTADINFGTGQFWFSDWKVSGTKLNVNEKQTYGPILFSQYALSKGVLKLTAQMPPIGAEDSQTVRLELKKGNVWKPAGEEKIHPQARTATFRMENWDSSKEVPYRLLYVLKSRGQSTLGQWAGTIRREPKDKPVLTVADVSCNIHAIFPNTEFVANMAKLDPDLLAFVGDQFYESCGGYGVQRTPLEPAILDYLRKWYFHGWTWRDLTKDRPSLSLPDDHDVYQGNLWGEAGEGRKTTQEAGGYDMQAEWVNVAHRTQASHHPDPYDPKPCQRGIINYYGPLTYGGVSFAVLADRQYKSGPEGKVPKTDTARGDHVLGLNFDPKTADLPGLVLLGEKQMQFLKDWLGDWKEAEMKAVISQTVFTAMATTHGGPDGELRADYDANGWPQTPRNEALKLIRKAFAFHIAGDQHLPAVVHYGIEAHKDAGLAFAGPAVNVGYPRWWRPEKTGRNAKTGTKGELGDFLDHFDNPMTVRAFANGPDEPPKPIMEQVVAKTSGLGLVRFDKVKRKITVDCWPYNADPTKPGGQFPGWPVEIEAMENYARKATAQLPKLEITGVPQPLVEVFEEKTGELVYALRLRDGRFQPHVFAAGNYSVKLSEPESGRSQWLKGLTAKENNTEAVKVKV
jgi:alkaline phosphatase D